MRPKYLRLLRLRFDRFYSSSNLNLNLNLVLEYWSKKIFIIKELSHLIKCFVDKTKWERLALPLVHIFVPMMLQRPSANSKPRDNVKYLLSVCLAALSKSRIQLFISITVSSERKTGCFSLDLISSFLSVLRTQRHNFLYGK